MWKYNCEKRNKYYNEVIRLYTQEGLGRTKISRIIPVGETTISRWIRNFTSENQVKVIMKRRTFINSGTPIADAENTEIKDLQA